MWNYSSLLVTSLLLLVRAEDLQVSDKEYYTESINNFLWKIKKLLSSVKTFKQACFKYDPKNLLTRQNFKYISSKKIEYLTSEIMYPVRYLFVKIFKVYFLSLGEVQWRAVYKTHSHWSRDGILQVHNSLGSGYTVRYNFTTVWAVGIRYNFISSQ